MKQVQTIFCDDIRQEVGGKLTYVGVYTGSLLASSFPVTLPKFCIAVSVVVDALTADVPMAVRVLKDEDVLAERDVQTRDLLESLGGSGPADDAGDDRVQIINSFFVFSPLQIDSPCVLRVRVKIGDEQLKGVGLGVARLQAPG